MRKSCFIKTMFEGHKPVNHRLTLKDVIKEKVNDKKQEPKVDNKKRKLTGKVTIIRF